MSIEIEGKAIETTPTGFLANQEDWTEDLAHELAKTEDIELTDAHWDVVNYLREEYFNNGGNQPNNRTMLKDMSGKWGRKVSSKDMYDLFPGNPSKQAGLIAGLPESMRKGGY
ncbi:MAG: TusE/DsrC/DsvC family sulfur relay protein [Gammaproteobacteria bacterium]|nr:TusE/DsrC/DsvC family sulfur relay protein [Gammaproteobacteria bacterium]